MRMDYYNENNPYVAQWLRNLVAGGQIPEGVVDDRSIAEVQPKDLLPYRRCHFFAGIGGWALALQRANWPEEKPVWTGSCPCQPFSNAGKKKGITDDRHLWPEFFRLIKGCKPPTVLGEQVASKDALAWYDTICDDLESASYTCRAVDLCAASVGAPHIRQRLWWVADTRRQCGESSRRELAGTKKSCSRKTQEQRIWHEPANGSVVSLPAIDPLFGFWGGSEWVECSDNLARPVEAGTFPLAHGIPHRVDRLRASGNAIVPQVAECLIKFYLEEMGRDF